MANILIDDNEQLLVKQVLTGDQDAFEVLVERYAGRLFNVCFNLLGNRQDAEDCVQEAFIKAYRAMPDYNFMSAFYTWMYRIAVNTCLDFRRKNKKGMTVSLDEGLETDDGHLFQQIPDQSPLPDELLERSEMTDFVREEIAKLPDYLREIIVLRDLEGLSYLELSRLLKLSEGTVKSRLSRARKQLMERIRKREQKMSSARLTDEKPTMRGKGGAG